jgi:hypothetical protein
VVADVNGDGHIDIIFGNRKKMSVKSEDTPNNRPIKYC